MTYEKVKKYNEKSRVSEILLALDINFGELRYIFILFRVIVNIKKELVSTKNNSFFNQKTLKKLKIQFFCS